MNKIDKIFKEICDSLNVSPDEIRGKSRNRKLINKRIIVVNELRRERFKYRQIGDVMDRSVSNVHKMSKANTDKEKVENLKKQPSLLDGDEFLEVLRFHKRRYLKIIELIDVLIKIEEQ